MSKPLLEWPNARYEGVIFVDPTLMVSSGRYLREKLRKNLLLAPSSTLRQIGAMYPSPGASEGEFGTQFDRANALISGFSPLHNNLLEWIFDCNTRWIANA